MRSLEHAINMLSVMLEGGLSKYCRAEKEGVHLQK